MTTMTLIQKSKQCISTNIKRPPNALPVSSLGPPNSFPWFDASCHPRSSCSQEPASSFHSAGAHGEVSRFLPKKKRVFFERTSKEPKEKKKTESHENLNFVQQFSYLDMSFDRQKKALQGFKKDLGGFSDMLGHILS